MLLSTVIDNHKKRKRRVRWGGSVNGSTGGGGGNQKGFRHHAWKHEKRYVCIRKGTPEMIPVAELDAWNADGRLTEACFYYFKHADERNTKRGTRIEPVWVVVLRTENGFVHPKQPFLKRIYKEMGRTNFEKRTELVDGLPYWVDIYISRVTRDMESKRKYIKKKRTH